MYMYQQNQEHFCHLFMEPCALLNYKKYLRLRYHGIDVKFVSLNRNSSRIKFKPQ